MSDIKTVEIINRATHSVGYTIQDTGVHRSFNPGEVKRLPLDELKQLAWTTGGQRILDRYLIIPDAAAREEIFGTSEVEPEYYYSKEDVENIVMNGTLEQLEDCLTFGSDGVKKLVIEVAFENKLPDINKRKLILEKTSYNLDNMIRLDEENNEGADVAADKVTAPKRKASVPEVKGRKAPTPTNYKIVADKK